MCRRYLFLFICIAALLLSGCAAPQKAFQYVGEEEGLIWPQQPDVPRYQYVGQLAGEHNFVAAGSSKFKDKMIKALKWMVGLFSSKRQVVVLQRPQGGMVGDDGRIYVTDVGRPGIYVFDKELGKFHHWKWADKDGGFLSPIAVAQATNGEILVTDSELGIVVRLDKEGEPLGSIGKGILKRPTGIAVDPTSGFMFVADAHEDNIKVFSDTGDLVDVIGVSGENVGEFNGPLHMVYSRGKIYIIDALNARVQVITAEGDYLKGFGKRGLFVGDIPHPKGIAVDSEDNIYVVESYHDHLLIYNSDGEFLLPIGGTGNKIGQFYLPAGVWADKQDRIYVADMFNARVMVFQYLGGDAK
jgi:DNA-binding beta-propeller fold protein YncE